MVRVLLVTSRLTFVPENYAPFLEAVLSRVSHLVAGVVFVDNAQLKTVGKIPLLGLLGARRLAWTMARNVASLPLLKREKMLAEKGIPWRNFPSMNHPEALAWVRQLGVDLVVNARTRDLYRSEILAAPRLGCINVHHGLLPEERGVMCDLMALKEGRPAGFSIHIMTKKLDDGAILARQVVSESGERDFLRHLHRGSQLEGEAVATLLEEVERRGALPEGIANRSDHVVYRKANLSYGLVKELRAKGVRL